MTTRPSKITKRRIDCLLRRSIQAARRGPVRAVAGGSFISYRRGGGLDLRQPFRQGKQHLEPSVSGHPAQAKIFVPL